MKNSCSGLRQIILKFLIRSANLLITLLLFPHAKDLRVERKRNKTGRVINDPLGQTHNHASSEHCFLLFCFSIFEQWGRTYGRPKTMIPIGRDFGLAEWIKISWAILALFSVDFKLNYHFEMERFYLGRFLIHYYAMTQLRHFTNFELSDIYTHTWAYSKQKHILLLLSHEPRWVIYSMDCS